MQIYNILPAPDGSWKAVLISNDQLVVSNECRDKLIDTMVKWAEKSGDPLTLRIYSAQGDLEEERIFEGWREDD